LEEDLKLEGYPTVNIKKRGTPIQMALIEIERKYKSTQHFDRIAQTESNDPMPPMPIILTHPEKL
jgi:hypothetical protein